MKTPFSRPSGPFIDSLLRLAHLAHLVPDGWRSDLQKALVSLHGVNCHNRESLVLSGPSIGDFALVIKGSAPDIVVDGLLRKLRTKTSSTCEICGRRGILRGDLVNIQVLCGRCAAPKLLKARMDEFIKLAEESVANDLDRVWSVDELPIQIRALLPSSAWKWVAGGRRGYRTSCVTDRSLLKCRDRFQGMSDLLDENTAETTEEPI